MDRLLDDVVPTYARVSHGTQLCLVHIHRDCVLALDLRLEQRLGVLGDFFQASQCLGQRPVRLVLP
ncbi:hypothetical protein D3C76_924260 [compost metagenome]